MVRRLSWPGTAASARGLAALPLSLDSQADRRATIVGDSQATTQRPATHDFAADTGPHRTARRRTRLPPGAFDCLIRPTAQRKANRIADRPTALLSVGTTVADYESVSDRRLSRSGRPAVVRAVYEFGAGRYLGRGCKRVRRHRPPTCRATLRGGASSTRRADVARIGQSSS